MYLDVIGSRVLQTDGMDSRYVIRMGYKSTGNNASDRIRKKEGCQWDTREEGLRTMRGFKEDQKIYMMAGED